jgi:hypothetical protein
MAVSNLAGSTHLILFSWPRLGRFTPHNLVAQAGLARVLAEVLAEDGCLEAAERYELQVLAHELRI